MNNPFKKKKRLTVKEKLNEQEKHIRDYLDTFLRFRPRIERLDKLYPDIISTVDFFISNRLTLRNGVKIPEEFLCSCRLLGLKVKEVKENNSYSYKEGQGFYYSIYFESVVGDDCDE